MSKCISTAQARAQLLSRSRRAAFYLIILPQMASFRCVSMCMSTAQARTKRLSYVLVLAWSEILARSSWWDPLSQVLAWRCCNRLVLEVVVWKLLYEALRRCLHQDFLSATPAAGLFNDDLGRFSYVSPAWRYWSRTVTRSCGDPIEMLSVALAWSFRGPSAKLLQRPSWNLVQVLVRRPFEILLKSSSKHPFT